MINIKKKLLSPVAKYLTTNSLTAKFFTSIYAKKLASKSKRLDICAAQISHLFHLAGLAGKFPIKDKVCLELGSGWVLSHALIFYILGAKKILATDIKNQAFPSSLKIAVNQSEISLIRDVLSPFEDNSLIRERLNKLKKINYFDFATLNELGIDYLAPIDLAQTSFNTNFDFIFSLSVLEHIPVDDVFSVLQTLTNLLSPAGQMIHCIHLEDHKNIDGAPFAFLAEAKETFTRELQSTRGNRIRRSEWLNLLDSINNIECQILYQLTRKDKEVPSNIDSSVKYVNQEDLSISHLGVCCKKIK